MLSLSVFLTAVLMALATSLSRFLPFLIGDRLAAPGMRRLFVERFPPTVLAVLIVFFLRDIGTAPGATQIANAAGILVTAAAHLAARNLLLSVGAGTATYMLLQAYPIL